MLFLSDQKIGGHQGPLTLIFSPKSSDQNFEIAILFSIVENHNNYVFEMTYSPKVPGGWAVSYKLRPVFTYSNGYLEVYRRFSGGLFWFGGFRGGGYVEGSFFGELCHGAEKFNEGGAVFSRIIIKKTIKNKYGKVFFNRK